MIESTPGDPTVPSVPCAFGLDTHGDDAICIHGGDVISRVENHLLLLKEDW